VDRARAAARRLAGRSDVSELTVPLMQEELRLRRARGEEIAAIRRRSAMQRSRLTPG
jgi:hypothetical protein